MHDADSVIGQWMDQNSCKDLRTLLRYRARNDANRTAIHSTDGSSITYGELEVRVDSIARKLHDAGFGPHDRIAVSLPAGEELACIILAVACVAVCAPVDCNAPVAQLSSQLRSMNARALVREKQSLDANEVHGITLLTPDEIGAGKAMQNTAGQGEILFPEPDIAPDKIAVFLQTSGTTATPKGVALSHANICLSAQAMAKDLGLDDQDSCLNLMPLFHVHGLVGTLLSPLVSGGSVILPGAFHAARFLDWFEETRPTWFSASPAILHQIARRVSEAPKKPRQSRLRFIRSASAPLSAKLLESLEQAFGVPVIEAYGMTEASHQISTSRPLSGSRKPGSLGKPSVVKVKIRSEAGLFVEGGQKGEIVIRGPTVIKRYEASNEENERAFADDWLRTGDLGYFDEQGDLYIVGRIKEIINRGGENISPAEVEQVLERHPAVREAGVFAVPDERLGEEVAACIVGKDGLSLDVRELQDYASGELADYKVPRHIFAVDALPKSSTGKLQRQKLATLVEPDLLKKQDGPEIAGHAAPDTPTQQEVARIWSEVLGIPGIGVHDEYLDIGGDSLQGVMILARIKSDLGVDLPIATLFGDATVASVAGEVDELIAAGATNVVAIERTEFPDDLRPLSFTQDLILEVSQDTLLKSSSAFNRIAVVRITGSLDERILESALTRIVNRHEGLRVGIHSGNGAPVARVRYAPDDKVMADIEPKDSKHFPSDELAMATIMEFGNRPYDISAGPLYRFGLTEIESGAHLLAVCVHYLVFDGWSMDLFMRELAVFYAAAESGSEPDLPELVIRHGDYAAWQKRQLESDALTNSIEHWKGQLQSGLPSISFDREKWTSPKNDFGLRQRVLRLETALVEKLRGVAKQNGTSLNMVMLAALKVMYAALEKQDDVVILIQSAGRREEATEPLIGNFVQTLPIRTQIDPRKTFIDLLVSVRSVVLDGMAHENVPFSRLIRDLFPGRNLLLDPISPMLFVFKNFPIRDASAGDTQFRLEELEERSEVFGLIVKVFEGPGQIDCNFLHNPFAVTDREAEILSKCYGAILERIASAPDRKVGDLLSPGVLLRTLGPGVILSEIFRGILKKVRGHRN